MLKFNGVTVITPKVFQVDIMDLDGESQRNAKGDMIRDRLAVKRKLNCEWGPLTMGEISSVLVAVKDPYVTVEYPDPFAGTRITRIFYVGDRQAPMLRHDNSQIKWEGLKFNLIEK